MGPPATDDSQATLVLDGLLPDGSPDRATSGIADVVALVSGHDDDLCSLAFAAALAQDYGAHLTSVFLQSPLVFSRPEAPPSEWRSLPAYCPPFLVAVHARHADVTIVSREVPRHTDSPDLVETLVMASGHPVIVVPPECCVGRVRRVLVCWNASPEAVRAVADALPWLRKAEAVAIVPFDVQDRTTGHGEEPGADIAQYLARHGARVEVQRLPSDRHEAERHLLEFAAAFEADLLVVGARAHSRLGRRSFSRSTRLLVGDAPAPILLAC